MQDPAIIAAKQDSDSVSLTGIQAVLSGSLITTQRGEIAAEDLRPGDRVVSRDRGLVPLRWIGRITADTRQNRDTAPIRIPRHALGRNLPVRDLYMAPDQKIWLKGAEFRDLFASHEVLIPAAALAGWSGITQATYLTEPTYMLLLFDQPEIIIADGLQIESRRPDAALAGLTCVGRDPMFSLFPDLERLAGRGAPTRRSLSETEAGTALPLQSRA
ncbi:MAG: hypothetical protein GYB25_01515 [Rhodobacteraceae bacterium]|nr:hypothetical protein [Paracoccaceae bacterium]